MQNQSIKTAKGLLTAGSIIGIVIGACWTITIVGMLWGIPTLVGGILMLKHRNLSDEMFIKKRTPILVWGIIFLFTTLVAGIFLISSYVISNINLEEEEIKLAEEKTNAEILNYQNIEKAYELKEKGIISEEEFENIKKRHL